MCLLHRDHFIDVDRAADSPNRTALRELNRGIETIGRHDRIAGHPARAAVADRGARADRLRGARRGAAIDDRRTELFEPLAPLRILRILRVALSLVRGDTFAAAVNEYVICRTPEASVPLV